MRGVRPQTSGARAGCRNGMAEDTIERYHADAAINGLSFDRHAEESAVELFARGVRMAGEMFLEDPFGIALIPNWNRVAAALPEFLDDLRDAVDADNKLSHVKTF